jgi:AraC-like DNA-binding protein
MRVVTERETWLVPATRAIWLPAALDHAIEIRAEAAMRTLYIHPDRSSALSALPRALEVAPLLRELILHICALGLLSNDRPEQERLSGLLIDLIVQARSVDLSLPLPADSRARALAARLQEAPHDPRDLDRLSRDAGASLRTLQRMFPKETGMTIEAWRQKARLIHSVARLSAGAGVTEAALDSGYQSVGAFIAAFKSQFGVTPGRY